MESRHRRPGPVFFVCLILILILVLISSARRAAADEARLTLVRPSIQSGELEVFLRVEGSFEHTVFKLEAPPRLVIDITPVREVTASGFIPVRAFGVESIRTGQPQAGAARVVFELSAQGAFYLVNKTPDGIRVSFLSGPGGTKIAPPAPAPGPPQPPGPEPPSAVPETKHITPRTHTTLVGFNLAIMTFADERFQDVFGHRTKSCLALDISQVLLTTGRWALAFGAEYQRLSLEGRSTVTGQATHVSIAPLNMGLRFLFRTGSFWPFASAGLAIYHYEEKSSLHNTLSYSAGFSLQGGVYFGTPAFRLLKGKAFIQWTRVVSEKDGLRVNLGGMEIGAGLALAFNLF